MGRTTTARYRALGDELQKRRHSAGLTQVQLARRTGWSSAKIFRIEHGQAEISAVDVVHYLGQCGFYAPQIRDLIAEFQDAESRHDYWLTLPGQWLDEWICALILYESTASKSVRL